MTFRVRDSIKADCSLSKSISLLQIVVFVADGGMGKAVVGDVHMAGLNSTKACSHYLDTY